MSKKLSLLILCFSLVSCSSLKRPDLKLGQGQRSYSPASSRPAAHGSGFDWPVDSARLTQKFKPRHRGRRHLGIDLAAPRGTALMAAQTGRVVYTGSDFTGFGRMVLIEGDADFATLYAHMDKIYVSEGQKVVIGDVIGEMGDSGRATGVHLHFELRKNKNPVDPLTYLPQLRKVANK